MVDIQLFGKKPMQIWNLRVSNLLFFIIIIGLTIILNCMAIFITNIHFSSYAKKKKKKKNSDNNCENVLIRILNLYIVSHRCVAKSCKGTGSIDHRRTFCH